MSFDILLLRMENRKALIYLSILFVCFCFDVQRVTHVGTAHVTIIFVFDFVIFLLCSHFILRCVYDVGLFRGDLTPPIVDRRTIDTENVTIGALSLKMSQEPDTDAHVAVVRC